MFVRKFHILILLLILLNKNNKCLFSYVYIYIYIYIYILKRQYKDIEESILHKRMMIKERIIYIDIYENLKSPYISILTC